VALIEYGADPFVNHESSSNAPVILSAAR